MFMRCYARQVNKQHRHTVLAVMFYSTLSTRNRLNAAMDDVGSGRNLPSISRPLAWERRRPFSANCPLDLSQDDGMPSVRFRSYHRSRYIPPRTKDDLFYQRTPADSSAGRLLEVWLHYNVYVTSLLSPNMRPADCITDKIGLRF